MVVQSFGRHGYGGSQFLGKNGNLPFLDKPAEFFGETLCVPRQVLLRGEFAHHLNVGGYLGGSFLLLNRVVSGPVDAGEQCF